MRGHQNGRFGYLVDLKEEFEDFDGFSGSRLAVGSSASKISG